MVETLAGGSPSIRTILLENQMVVVTETLKDSHVDQVSDRISHFMESRA
jgi:hypothetical protein